MYLDHNYVCTADTIYTSKSDPHSYEATKAGAKKIQKISHIITKINSNYNFTKLKILHKHRHCHEYNGCYSL